MTDIPTWKQKLEQQYINLAFDPAAALSDLSKKEASYLKKKKDEVTIRSSAAEYLTYVASVGGQQDSIEMRYEDENIWLTQRMMSTLYDVGLPTINEHSKTTKQFFAKVQNKMHYAVHGHTAAELIYERADADKPHMGLTTWAAAPEGKTVKSDVSIAKNYLTDKEMCSLERIVSAYLDLAMERCRHQP